MKRLKITVVVSFLAVAASATAFNHTAQSMGPRSDLSQSATATTSDTGTTDEANVASADDVTVDGNGTLPDGSPIDGEGVAFDDDKTFNLYEITDELGDPTPTPTPTPSPSPTPTASPAPSPIPAAGAETTAADTKSATTTSAATSSGAAMTFAATFCPNPLPAPAPAGFDNRTNGVIPQGTPVPKGGEPTPGTFEGDKAIFSQVDEIGDGLGPVYNAQSCRECHQNPVTGAISQITELRAGHNATDAFGNTIFVDAPGGSLINDRATDRRIQERVPPLYTAGAVSGPALTRDEPVRTQRTSLNTLGDGFVEAVADGSLIAIANSQFVLSGGQVRGQAIAVPVLEAGGVRRVARFGWKNQHASLLSFSGDAYLNEIGITNRLVLNENTSLGRFVGFGSGFDPVRDNQPCEYSSVICGEDTERDVDTFAEFMRATKTPPRNQDVINKFTADVTAGAQLFASMPSPYGPQISCSICHVPSILTAPPCTRINGGAFTVPVALGNKVIHPFSDFLLHDVGTGDGITQNGGPLTRLKVRTPPLWGVSTRDRLMHDGQSLTFREAILRHGGEAATVINNFRMLTETQKRQLIIFLESL